MRKYFNANELRVRLEEEQQKVIEMIQTGGHVVLDPSSRSSSPDATNIQLEVTHLSYLSCIIDVTPKF